MAPWNETKKRCEQKLPRPRGFGSRSQWLILTHNKKLVEPPCVLFFVALYFFPTKNKSIIGETKQVISKKVVEVVQACVYFLPTSASNIVLVLDVKVEDKPYTFWKMTVFDVALLCITWMICRNSEIEWFVLKLRSL